MPLKQSNKNRSKKVNVESAIASANSSSTPEIAAFSHSTFRQRFFEVLIEDLYLVATTIVVSIIVLSILI